MVVVGVCLLAQGLVVADSGAQEGGSGGVSLGDVVVRDELIAAQESLLNTYRCLFDVDVEVVPGGCVDGQPARGATAPGVFEGVPTAGDVAVRDRLVAEQESLLNTYRCLFDVDVEIVPGGCAGGRPGVAPGAVLNPVEVPGPGDRAVLAQQAVGQAGAVVSDGAVSVSVPAGAVDAEVQVAIHERLGEFGGEVGGEVVSVDHQGPVRSPITVTWDVSHLSAYQQEALVLVRWDDGLADWVLPAAEPEYEIVGGVLRARIAEWSFWTWIANVSQTLQEILGRRVDAPKCAEGDLPRWVESASETDTGFHADAIRLCFEDGPGGSVRVKMANNRTFGQFIHFDGGDGFTKPVLDAFDVSPSGIWPAKLRSGC